MFAFEMKSWKSVFTGNLLPPSPKFDAIGKTVYEQFNETRYGTQNKLPWMISKAKMTFIRFIAIIHKNIYPMATNSCQT